MFDRTRNATLTPLAEKGLISAKAPAKAKALEAILLYVELDTAPPVLDELIPLLSHKLPKIVAATLSALTSIYHAYGCKTVEPKPVLQQLPKVYGHADKNVRAEAQNLTVELYRWLREGMKPLFWNELKPVQQQDLDKMFEKVKDEPAPKPERLLRSQQAAKEAAADVADTQGAEDEGEVEDDAEAGFEPEIMAVDVFPKIPKDLQERLASSKWKDRKDALDDLHTAINVPAIEEGPFDEIIQGLAKCMKDANIMVVTLAGNCVELLAKGLRKSITKYRSTVFSPIMERLKERKQSVTDSLAGALDAICASTSIGDCLEETLGFLTHKNPLIKLEATRFLARALKGSKDAPTIPELKTIADACIKLLTDSQDNQRNAGAEVLGILWKIMGDRVMIPHFEGLDDIRKAKIKEYMESAEVKSKYKPKAAPAPKTAPAAAGQKKPAGKRPASSAPSAKKPTATAPTRTESPAPQLQPKPSARPGALPKPGATGTAPRGLKPPAAGTAGRKLPTPGGSAQSGNASPRRPLQASPVEDEPTPAPKVSRGLTGRQLSKPSALQPASPTSSPKHSGPTPLPSADRIELDELRLEVDRLRSSNETLRSEHLKLSSQVTELQDQNAQLIEDHTRDVLSIKAKETQLVRARSDAESAEQSFTSLQREVERLKRELNRMGRASSPRSTEFGAGEVFPADGVVSPGAGVAPVQSGLGGPRSRATAMSPPSREGKENMPHSGQTSSLGQGRKLSQPDHASAMGPPSSRTSNDSSARPTSGGSPHRLDQKTQRRPISMTSGLARPTGLANGSGAAGAGAHRSGSGSTTESDATQVGPVLSDSDARSSANSSSSTGADAAGAGAGGQGVASWKRAAEVTQNLKARIELMKAKQQQQQGRNRG